MDINTILVIGFVTLFSYLVYKSLRSQESSFIPQRTGLLVAQDTGKTKHNQSKTGDISLAIERIRRRVIQASGRSDKTKIKETRTQLGSSTGALETYMISSICPCPVPVCDSDIIFDGGNQNADYCEYLGDGYLDAGNENTEACGPPECKPHDAILDGGNQNSNYCEYVGDGYLDAGNETTEACGPLDCDPHDAILDGGNQNSNYCEYVGDGYLDAGNESTEACGPPECKPHDVILDGGNQNSNYCEYVGDGYLDAGDATTKACGV